MADPSLSMSRFLEKPSLRGGSRASSAQRARPSGRRLCRGRSRLRPRFFERLVGPPPCPLLPRYGTARARATSPSAIGCTGGQHRSVYVRRAAWPSGCAGPGQAGSAPSATTRESSARRVACTRLPSPISAMASSRSAYRPGATPRTGGGTIEGSSMIWHGSRHAMPSRRRVQSRRSSMSSGPQTHNRRGVHWPRKTTWEQRRRRTILDKRAYRRQRRGASSCSPTCFGGTPRPTSPSSVHGPRQDRGSSPASTCRC